MYDKPESGESRREEIEQRLAAIRTRMDELKAVRQDDASPAAVSTRIDSAERRAAASQAAAQRAIAASIRAFRRAAEAHEHAALQYERAAAAGFGDKKEHQRQAARHRAAAAVDIQRAERAQSLLRMKRPGTIADQALNRLIHDIDLSERRGNHREHRRRRSRCKSGLRRLEAAASAD